VGLKKERNKTELEMDKFLAMKGFISLWTMCPFILPERLRR
jgi:hypothetical protein